MQLTIKNGSLDLSGEQILSSINFEITDNINPAVGTLSFDIIG